MKINIEKLKARGSDIRKAIENIQKYSSLPDEEFWQDERNLFAVKYLMLQCMEAIGSICVHILAKKFQVSVSNYAECFERLGELGVLPEQLSVKLRKMIRFRNVLVHRYWDVDDKIVVQYARQDVNDFIDMLKTIWDFLGIKP